jgi:hypothetical protein
MLGPGQIEDRCPPRSSEPVSKAETIRNESYLAYCSDAATFLAPLAKRICGQASDENQDTQRSNRRKCPLHSIHAFHGFKPARRKPIVAVCSSGVINLRESRAVIWFWRLAFLRDPLPIA